MYRSLILLAPCFLLVAMTGRAADAPAKKAEPERLKLWNGNAPMGDGKFEKAEAWITVHKPEKPNGAAVVICPGGGYGGLVTGAEGHGIAAWLNRHGITGVVLEYRLPKGRSFVPLLDAQRAIRTVRANAKAWGIDPAKIGIMGFSAGGHLASTAGTHFDDGDPKADDPIDRISCRPDFMILVYPVITMGEKTHGGSRNNLLGKNPDAKLVELFSNEKQVTAKTPPAFLAHAKDDRVGRARQQQGVLRRPASPEGAGEVPGVAVRRPRAERLQGADVGRLARTVAGVAGRDEAHSCGERQEVERVGETDRRGRITRRGPRMLRAALVECAWCSLRYNRWARDTWLRLQGNGLSKKKAVVALSRKLLVRCWAILRTGQPWRAGGRESPVPEAVSV